MIHFLGCTLSNFRSFVGGPFVLNLQNRGLVRVVGENLDDAGWSPANGSGKSTLLDSIEWCLFGVTPSGGGVDSVVPHGSKDETSVQLAFFDDVLHTRFDVTRSRKGSKSALQLWSIGPGYAKSDLTKHKADDTQLVINAVLGLDRRIWRAACYWAQGETFDFARATDAERKEILARLIPELGEVGKLAKVIATKHADTVGRLGLVEQDIARDSGHLQGLLARNWESERTVWLAQQQTYLQGLAQQGQQLLAEITAQGQALAKGMAEAQTLPSVRGLYTLAQAHRARSDAQARLAAMPAMPVLPAKPQAIDAPQLYQLAEQGKKNAAWIESIDKPSEAEKHFAEMRRSRDHRIAVLDGERARLTKEQEASKTSKICPTCGQARGAGHVVDHGGQLAALDAERATALQESLSFEAQEANAAKNRHAQVAQARQDLDALRQQYAVLAEASKQHAAAEAAYQAILRAGSLQEAQMGVLHTESSITLPALPQGWTEQTAAQEIGRLEAVERSLAGIDAARRKAETQEAQVRATHVYAAAQPWPGEQAKAEAHAQAQALYEAIHGHEAQRSALQARLRALTFWKDACGATELPSLILSSRVQELTDSANDGVQRLTDGRFSVTFDAISQTKGGELRDKTTLTISRQLTTGEVIAQDFRDYSGGEKDRIALGTSYGLALMVARQAKKPIDYLAIDEAFSAFLDAGGREKAEALVNELAKTRATVLVVSHLAGIGANTPQIMVRKQNGRSLIASGGV